MSGVSITNGQSKFDLMQALLVRKPVRPSFNFTLEDNKTIVCCMVDSVESEDGSGESYNIEGWVASRRKKFKAYYRTDDRTGTYTVLGQE